MKCQNCGINYDDSEKECPMCGTKAGRGTHTATPHYTGYGHTVHDEKSCTHQTFTRDQSFSARPQQQSAARRVQPAAKPRATVLNGEPAKKKNGRGASIAVVIIVILLSVLLPLVQSLAEHWDELRYYLQDSSPYDQVAPLPATDAYDYGDDDMILEPVLQGDWVVERADGGTLKFSIDSNNEYTLTCETEQYSYSESGEVYLWYNHEDEEWYWNDTYTPEEYNGYSFYLYRREMSGAGALPAALASSKQREVVLVIFEKQAEADGTRFVVWDYAKTGAPLFSEELMEMHKVQGG